MSTECEARRHNTTRAYNYHRCRCPQAVAAASAHQARMRARWQRTATRPKRRRDDGYVDEVAVERACHGDRVLLSRREAVAAAKLLIARGASIAKVAELLGVARKTVELYRDTP